MTNKPFESVGLEYDSVGIRAARVTTSWKGKEVRYKVEDLRESKGHYSSEDALIHGLKALRDKFSIRSRDRVIVGASGRQVYVAQFKFRDLPPAEMKNSLQLEIRKNLTFEASGSAFDYQVLPTEDPEKKNKPTVMVTAAASGLVEYHLRILGKAGITPWVLDVLPATIANAFWLARPDSDPGVAHLILHFSPDMCTAVIDGAEAPFYSRSILFAAQEIYGPSGQDIPEQDRSKRLAALTDELRRSLSYYGKTYGVSNFKWLCLFGQYVQQQDLRTLIPEKLEMDLDESTLAQRMGAKASAAPGQFDVALALALRGCD